MAREKPGRDEGSGDRWDYGPNLSAARALALAAASSRFLGGALVSSECRRRNEMPEISSTAAANAASFGLDGLLKPLILRTNCRDAARTSSSEVGREHV